MPTEHDLGGRRLAAAAASKAAAGDDDEVRQLIAPLEPDQLRAVVLTMATNQPANGPVSMRPTSTTARRLLVGQLASLIVAAAVTGCAELPEDWASGGSTNDWTGAEVRTSRARVGAVLDGDTLRVETVDGVHLGRVRLLGLDAPEVAHGQEPAECYSVEATDQSRQLTPIGSTVLLRSDPSQPTRDRYGRMLRYVAADGEPNLEHDLEGDGQPAGGDVTLQLLEQGAGELYPSDPPLAQAKEYAAAAARAQETGAGHWGACT